MTLPDRLENAIIDRLEELTENLEETNDELEHGPLGWAFAMTSITLGLLFVGVGATITILESGGTHGPALMAFAGLMAALGAWMLATHDPR